MDMKIERARLNRQQSTLIIDKGIIMYLAFLSIAIFGLISNYFTISNFFLLVLVAFSVLAITSLPYLTSIMAEKKELDSVIKYLEDKVKK